MLNTIIKAALEAGKAILEVYDTDFLVEFKQDDSPLTLADKKAHAIISGYIATTGLPVLSEEGKTIPYETRRKWERFWMVDPLDGTKEFIKKNGEFTVNIALIEKGKPVMGVVYAPVLDLLYVGTGDRGSFRIEQASRKELANEWTGNNQLPLISRKDYFGVVASRSHLNPETEAFIATLAKQHRNVKTLSVGSSLKLCMVAEGKADIYPRFAPTMEWDTAAGDAVVRSAGGKVLQAKSEQPLQYNKENLLNPWFIVSRF